MRIFPWSSIIPQWLAVKKMRQFDEFLIRNKRAFRNINSNFTIQTIAVFNRKSITGLSGIDFDSIPAAFLPGNCYKNPGLFCASVLPEVVGMALLYRHRYWLPCKSQIIHSKHKTAYYE